MNPPLNQTPTVSQPYNLHHPTKKACKAKIAIQSRETIWSIFWFFRVISTQYCDVSTTITMLYYYCAIVIIHKSAFSVGIVNRVTQSHTPVLNSQRVCHWIEHVAWTINTHTHKRVHARFGFFCVNSYEVIYINAGTDWMNLCPYRFISHPFL